MVLEFIVSESPLEESAVKGVLELLLLDRVQVVIDGSDQLNNVA